jgi:hypothetical protein
MKKIILGFTLMVILVACNQLDKKTETGTENKNETITGVENTTETIDKTTLTTIEWLDTQEKDLGKVNEGEKLEVSFRFKNTGSKPLVISRVWAQCGCTVPETPKEPYAPGQEGIIKASFDSKGRLGMNTKEVYVNANTEPATNTLTFKVEVNNKL